MLLADFLENLRDLIGAAQERLVQIGQLENDYIEIKQGVAEGETVATSNVNVLYDGVTVRQ